MKKYTQTTNTQPILLPGHPVELLPASLLQYRKTWQPLVNALPQNAYLVVTTLDRKQEGYSMRRLVNALRQQGQLVYVLSVGG